VHSSTLCYSSPLCGASTRKAHKNRGFIINPLSGKLIFQGQVQCNFQGQVQGQILGQGHLQSQSQVLGQGQSLGQDHGRGRGQGQCLCYVYASGFARGLPVYSAAGTIYRINSLIYTGRP